MRGRPKADLVLVQSEREQLQAWSQRRKTAPASACLRKPMICSSVNLLFFMSVILLVDGLH